MGHLTVLTRETIRGEEDYLLSDRVIQVDVTVSCVDCKWSLPDGPVQAVRLAYISCLTEWADRPKQVINLSNNKRRLLAPDQFKIRTVHESLQRFLFQPEGNVQVCPDCGCEGVTCSKSNWVLPDLLIVVQDSPEDSSIKWDTGFTLGGKEYELVAAVFRRNTIHYVCNVRTPDNTWWHYNDQGEAGRVWFAVSFFIHLTIPAPFLSNIPIMAIIV